MGLLRKDRKEWHADQVAATWQAASVLMDYPDEDHPIEALRSVLPGLPPTAREGLGRFLDHREATDLGTLQAEYVETFDTRRRCCLFLTYFLHGDTRKRGMALLRFKQTYLAAGLALRDEELPDHLCVVLEYGASVDPEGARQLLQDHRAGLELLRLSLGDLDSPWAPVMEAVSATLPPLQGEEREAVRRLAAAGPPEEEVGLTPYAMPEVGSSGPVDLPMPTLPVRKGA
ncbi:nitrate reductase molybdenum cofactor assembly chaperone [Nocardioides sp.]|uniref:nitrate reductase molybdenum cofactor assembly chaperone n=1 Tax=Nocardioides sp. TaxID=35761 RepID=UPI002735C9F6|nr:nitrate reductase molybdenum cofactor assembly chaperone [Nocardioides sp.]MDP3894224.1 nitrate reductase molybdenum cofactor assembly chaperone [Nocardioides sp.]